MRNITKQASEAFKLGKDFHLSNTEVKTRTDLFGNKFSELFLHGNKIASLNFSNGQLLIRDCNRRTTTTKERLNGILSSFNLGGIFQRNFQRFLSHRSGRTEVFNGFSEIDVNFDS